MHDTKSHLSQVLCVHTVAVESPESSVATFKPFERVVTLVSGTLYNDYNNGKKVEILIANYLRSVFLCISRLVRISLRVGKNLNM